MVKRLKLVDFYSLPRIVMAFIFLIAAFLKGLDPTEFAFEIGVLYGRSSAEYLPLAYLIIGFEIFVGLGLLFLGVQRLLVVLTGVLLLLFAGVIFWQWLQGIHSTCSCFGSLIQRSLAAAVIGDLLLLVSYFLTLCEYRKRGSTQGLNLSRLFVVSLLAALLAFLLPLVPGNWTLLRVGVDLRGQPPFNDEIDLSKGRYLVVLLQTSDTESRQLARYLNELSPVHGGHLIIGVIPEDESAVTAFWFEELLRFPLFSVDRRQLEPYFRALPDVFSTKDGIVTGVYRSSVPSLELLVRS